MRKTALVISLVALVWPAPGHAVCNHCTAEQVTLDTAKKLLPGGSDAIGGVGDWYLSNDRVEAVIDDIATVDIDVAGGGTVSVDRTSSNAVATGGTLIDLGLRKKRNDQLPQSFNVGGLSIDNVFLFRQGDEVPWGASTNPCASVGTANPECPADNDDCAAITVYGIMLMPQVSSRTDPKLRVRTRYQACDDDFHLTVTSEVWNQSGATQSLPIIDVFLWGGRGLEPFVPGKGRGFSHPQLDLTNPLALGANLASTRGLYFAAPGNSDNKDGKYTRGKTGNSVSYGYRSLGAKKDSNGGNPGGTLTQIVAPDQVVALHSDFLSAVSIGTLLSGTDIPNGQSIVFTREFVVGKKNDVHSVVSDRRNPSNLITKIYGDGVGRVSGRFRPGSKNFGTVTFIRIGDRPGDPPLSPPIGGQTDPAKQGNEPVTSVRTKAGWSNVLLPPGLYALHIVVPGRDEVIVKECTGGDNDGGLCQDDSECPGGGVCGFSVGPFEKVSFGTIDVPEKEGLLKVEITDADTGERIPAKLSLDPSPNMRRELAAYSFAQRFNFSLNLFRGMCANDFTVGCNSSADCGGNTCFSTCSNQEPKKCTDNSDCNTGAGEVCASDKRCRSEACTSDSDCDPGAICVPDTAETDVASFAGGPGQKNVIYTHNGKVKERIRPGTYTIYVSRGIEYTIQKLENVVVPSGGTVELAASLRRVVDTTGYMSADFHIHSGRSLDSSAPFEDRVRSFAGEGLEVMVSTDHDITTDYEPVIKKLGLRDFIAAIPGTEITTSVSQPPYASNAWGHINAWPQVFGLFAPRNGSIEDEGVSPNVIFDRARGSVCSGGDNDGLRCNVDADCPGGDCVVHGKMCAGGKDAGNPCTDDSECRKGTCADVVVQLNHPRAGVSGVVGIGQFNNIGFDPSAPLTDCQKYPVVCPSNRCVGGTNDGGSCTDPGRLSRRGLRLRGRFASGEPGRRLQQNTARPQRAEPGHDLRHARLRERLREPERDPQHRLRRDGSRQRRPGPFHDSRRGATGLDQPSQPGRSRRAAGEPAPDLGHGRLRFPPDRRRAARLLADLRGCGRPADSARHAERPRFQRGRPRREHGRELGTLRAVHRGRRYDDGRNRRDPRRDRDREPRHRGPGSALDARRRGADHQERVRHPVLRHGNDAGRGPASCGSFRAEPGGRRAVFGDDFRHRDLRLLLHRGSEPGPRLHLARRHGEPRRQGRLPLRVHEPDLRGCGRRRLRRSRGARTHLPAAPARVFDELRSPAVSEKGPPRPVSSRRGGPPFSLLALAVLCAGGAASAHWLTPDEILAGLRQNPVLRDRYGVVRVEVDPKLERLLVLRVDVEKWTSVPREERLRVASEWWDTWRHNVPSGIVAVVDARTEQVLVNYDASGRPRLRDPTPRPTPSP
ncbi:MAG: hypothetical protein KatS3mg076_1710 [Candidatus Binatia bacterium]|nr:MAG: hypothetical protein KatS3mg076_1710 [Candidatus Binatia bacterium]